MSDTATVDRRIPEMPWCRDIDPLNLWRRCARVVWNFLMRSMVPGQTRLLVRDWEIARACGFSLRWVQKALKILTELGVILRYRIYGHIKEAGRVIELLIAPAGWFAQQEKGPRRPKGAKPAAVPVNSSYVPVAATTPEQLETARKAAQPTAEEKKAAEAQAAEKARRAKGIWESLPEETRKAIRTQVERENPTLRHWPAIIEGLCVERALADHGPKGGDSSDQPRAP
jgi:hypothetical protein